MRPSDNLRIFKHLEASGLPEQHVRRMQAGASPASGMNPSQTRPSLLIRVRDPADVDAWDQFASQYGELIVRYAQARGLQYCDAEDVRQVLLTKLATTLRSFEYQPGRGRFRDYLGAAVRNAVNSWRRCPGRPTAVVGLSDVAEPPDPTSSEPDPLWEQEWMAHHYRRALESLRQSCEPQSIAVFTRLLAGASVEEAAQAESMTVDAVRKVRQRVRARMAELVEQQIHEEDPA